MTLREEYEEVSSLPKEEFAAIYNSWASTISQDYYNFLIADHLDRANHCMDAEPFCTSDVYNFPALNSGYSWEGPNYGCLRTSPTTKHSFWYYMRIGVAGNITILIEASFDVDFALWGPFSNQIDPCPTEAGQTGLLTADCSDCPNNTSTTQPNFYPSGNLHDCSFDARHYEYAHVVNGEVGQYFILLITNYSGSDGSITFQKFAGDGETDCGIMPGSASNDGPYCEGETIQLHINEQPNATYLWTGPDGWTSTEPNPTRENCTLAMAGTYSIVTTVGAQTTPATTVVNVYQQPTPSFTATTVCEGETTQFEGLASGANVANYDWDFGDDETGSGQIVSHTYSEAGTYQVTLVVTAEDGTCPGEITQTVAVNAMPVPTATANPNLVIYDGTATLTGNSGIQGSCTYHWEPANMVTDPNSPTTQTVPLHETVVYTLTVTNTEGGCTATTQVAVSMEGSNLAATAYADENQLCENFPTTIHATPTGGTGNYTYSWTGPDNFTSTQQAPTVTPPVGTNTYTCQVGDGLVTQQASVTIVVNPRHETSISETECDLFTWDPQGHTFTENGHSGNNYDESGTYIRTYANQYGCDSIVTLNLTVNKSLSDTRSYDNTCDYDIQFEWFGEPIHFEENGVYAFDKTTNPNAQTIHGCDTTMTVTITNLHYEPQPSPIYCTDENAVVYGPNHDTIAVVTNTEFFSFQYVFKVNEAAHSSCIWDNCEWTISKPSWAIESTPVESSDGYYSSECTVYVAEQDDDIVTLTATISNDCGSEERKFYLKSSFLGMNENDIAAAKVNIVPNPNNGQMHINFEDMEGPTFVKVLDMTGTPIDAFETNVSTGRYCYDYTMKQHAQGIYFFVFANNNRVFAKKVVIIQ
jgi:PKD repeat protein